MSCGCVSIGFGTTVYGRKHIETAYGKNVNLGGTKADLAYLLWENKYKFSHKGLRHLLYIEIFL